MFLINVTFYIKLYSKTYCCCYFYYVCSFIIYLCYFCVQDKEYPVKAIKISNLQKEIENLRIANRVSMCVVIMKPKI